MSKKHFTEAKRVTKNTTKSKKGQADNRGSGQAGSGTKDRTTEKKTRIQQKTRERVAQYIGGETGVRHGNRCTT